MLAGIRDILIISTPDDKPLFERLLGSGSDLELHFTYLTQDRPRGLADVFIIARDFVGSNPVAEKTYVGLSSTRFRSATSI
jgi:glucose-1-phosphate thymidylyltransferase